jgi:hypothetical protein
MIKARRGWLAPREQIAVALPRRNGDPPRKGAAMTDLEIQTMRRENDYLKQRNAQLQTDLTDVSAETERLRQALERLDSRQGRVVPNPMSAGQ